MHLSWSQKWGLILVTCLVSLGASLLWWWWEVPLLTPLTNHPTFQFLSHEPSTASGSGKIMYGYLPYWNVSKAQLAPELTHLNYFALTIGGDGKVVTQQEDHVEPGYQRLQSDQLLDLSRTVTARGGKMEVTLAQFNNDAIVSLLTNPAAHDNLITAIDSLLLAYPISGINLDIEYSGEVNDNLRQKYVDLTTKINTHLDEKYQHVSLSMAMYASAANRYQIWDVAKLAPQLDQIVIMAYDFHRSSSPQAGPVAPLFGGRELWDSDISEHLHEFIKVTPKEKMLLGIPFYGYEWQTTSRDAQAHTFPETGATASYSRVQDILNKKEELQVQEHWNEAALSPYISYVDHGQTYVIYYENSRSLSYKLDYVNQLDLGGIAIWALGYEGNSRELWDVIKNKL